MRQESGGFARGGQVLPVPALLRPPLAEPEGERDVPGFSPSPEDQGATRRQRKHDGAVPRQAQGDALANL